MLLARARREATLAHFFFDLVAGAAGLLRAGRFFDEVGFQR
jgi:hypothetical protein